MIKLLLGVWIAYFIIGGCCLAQSVIAPPKPAISDVVRRLAVLPNDSGKLSVLLQLSKHYVNKPGTAADDMKAALSYGQKALDLSLKLHDHEGEGRSYTVLSQIFRERGDLRQGKQLSDKALALFARYPVPEPAADAYFEAANYDDSDLPISSKLKIAHYHKGLEYLERAQPQPLKLADALKFMGDLYQYHGEYKISMLYLLRSLSIYQHIHQKNLQEIYSLIGNVYVQLGQHEEGIRYNLLAARAVNESADSTMIACEIYNNLANAYNNIMDVSNAIIYLQKARIIALKNHDMDAAQYISANIAEDYSQEQPEKAILVVKSALALGPVKRPETYVVLMDEALRAYTALKKYDLARPYYEFILQNFKGRSVDKDYLLGAYADLLKYLIATKQYTLLRKYRSSITISPNYKPGILPQLIIENLAFQVDSAQENYFAAMQHSARYMNLNIKNLQKGYNEKIASLQVKYATKTKDLDIALLTHQNQMQKIALADQRLIRNLIIAGAALLILLLGLGYSRYQIKQEANKALEQQQLAISEQNKSLQQQQEAIHLQNESLLQLVSEREWLLKEVHHRVKNNLQIVISLLNSQLHTIQDSVAKNVIRESQHRIHSISLIHQKFYQHNDVSGIGMHEYIRDLLIYLQESFDSFSNIEFVLDAQPINLDVSQAVPLALILNEAITNAIKHAFKDQTTKGRVSISLKKVAGKIQLEISDNGSGLPPDFDVQQCKSLGMKLIYGLTRQLKGNVVTTTNNGLHITISINIAPMFTDRQEKNETAKS